MPINIQTSLTGHNNHGGIPMFRTSKGNEIVLKNRVVREIGGKITVFEEERDTAFGSSYGKVRNNGLRNRGSNILIT